MLLFRLQINTLGARQKRQDIQFSTSIDHCKSIDFTFDPGINTFFCFQFLQMFATNKRQKMTSDTASDVNMQNGVHDMVMAAGASPSVTVALHPLVIMNVSDQYTRIKAQDGNPNPQGCHLHIYYMYYLLDRLICWDSKSMEYSIGVLWSTPWSTFGALSGHFWSTFGALLEYFWGTFRVLLGYFWSTFGILLHSSFGVFLDYF